MNFLKNFENRNIRFWVVLEFLLIFAVGALDLWTGSKVEVSFFYLIPVSLVAWFTNRWFGVAASIFSAAVWLITEEMNRQSELHPAIPVWNALIILGFFVTVALLISALRKTLEQEREMARTDYLTGAVNSRLFIQLLQMEINRAQRYKRPFTLAYIDIDNFKEVNDRFGHAAGDQVLRAVVEQARKNLRKTDVIARLGGDEFAVLLPETDQESAQAALTKIQCEISKEACQGNWCITLSIGALTCITAPQTTDQIIRIADDLMYEVKRGTKNAVKSAIYAE